MFFQAAAGKLYTELPILLRHPNAVPIPTWILQNFTFSVEHITQHDTLLYFQFLAGKSIQNEFNLFSIKAMMIE